MIARSAILLLVFATLMAACGGESAMTFPELPGGPSAVHPFSVDFRPRALFGGTSAVGTVHLWSPAPAGGLEVTLASRDSAVVVPASVVIPAGRLSTDFAVITSPVTADVTAMVDARSADRAAAGSLPVWAQLPEYFSWISEPSFQAGRIGRFTASNASFTASCRGSEVHVSAQGEERWFVGFAAPPNQPMRAGAYENAASTIIGRNGPALSLTIGSSIACFTPINRFVVHEIEVRDDGTVPRFRATFEQRCSGSLALRGDVRVSNPRSDRSPFDRTPCLR